MNLLNCLGIGTVTSTKNTNTDEIMVYLKGYAPAADGRAVATAAEAEQSGVDAYGQEVKTKVMTSNSFPATWRAMGDTNRITSPDVREGTQVAIYNVTGSRKYYWTTWGVNAATFRLETVIQGYSANPSMNEDTPFNIDNFYTTTVSTHEGFMALRTTMANDEQTSFEVKVDGKNGQVIINSNEKNVFLLDDMNHQLLYKNADGSIFDITKKKMQFYAPDSFTAFAEETFSIKTKQFNLLCENIAVKATKAVIKIDETDWTGNITQTGDYDQTGDYTQEGNTKREGSSHSSGIVVGVSGVFSALNALDEHYHAGVRNGDGETTPPVPGTGQP